MDIGEIREEQRHEDALKIQEELTDAKKKLEFLKSKGLTVGWMKTSDKPDPYLMYVIEPDSELCDLRTVNKLIDSESEKKKWKDCAKTLLSHAEHASYCASVIHCGMQGCDCGLDATVEQMKKLDPSLEYLETE